MTDTVTSAANQVIKVLNVAHVAVTFATVHATDLQEDVMHAQHSSTVVQHAKSIVTKAVHLRSVNSLVPVQLGVILESGESSVGKFAMEIVLNRLTLQLTFVTDQTVLVCTAV